MVESVVSMKISRSFTVIRYENALLFDDARTKNNIVKRYKGAYPIVDFNEQIKAILIIDPQKKTKCMIHADHIVVDINDPRDLNALKTTVNDIVPFVLKELEIQTTQYIGVRAHAIPELLLTKDKTEAEILRRYYSPALLDFIKNENPQDGINPHVGFSIMLGAGFTMNVNIAPSQNVTGEVGPDGQLHIKEFVDSNPLVDLDVYTDVSKELTQINGVIKGACGNIEKYLEKVWNMHTGSVFR
ncbi:MAG: hypothetical protein K6T94_22380 [Paenibacillus sp.]|nr:hypothetical protein [Paenibacillus sp.]